MTMRYLLWSNKHGAWWRPGDRGYTVAIDEAGRYTEAEAVQRVINSAMCGIRQQVTCMVAAPDMWDPPADVVADQDRAAELAEDAARAARDDRDVA